MHARRAPVVASLKHVLEGRDRHPQVGHALALEALVQPRALLEGHEGVPRAVHAERGWRVRAH